MEQHSKIELFYIYIDKLSTLNVLLLLFIFKYLYIYETIRNQTFNYPLLP